LDASFAQAPRGFLHADQARNGSGL
jgi:hypothetical protein